MENENLIPLVLAGIRTVEDDEEFDRAMKELESLCEEMSTVTVCGTARNVKYIKYAAMPTIS